MTEGLSTQGELALNLERTIRLTHNLQVNNLSADKILEISREIPENVTDLNASYAEHLAGRFLKGMDICADLYTLAISYDLRMDALRKSAFSKAMLVHAVERGISTAKDREQFAYSDPEYLQANEHCIEAKVFKTMLEEKKQVLSKAHHLMKNIVNNDANHLSEVVNKGERSTTTDDEDDWVAGSQWTKK